MIVRQSRNVSLTPELERFIVDRLGSGDYANASEVVRAGLRALRDGRAPRAAGGWPVGGGECGALIRDRDWATTPLGPVEHWSPALRATVANILNSPVAKVLMWGPDHVMLYNDAYRTIAAERHPAALGSGVAAMFPELWDWNRPILAAGLRGEVVAHRDQPIVFDRGEATQTLHLDLFYTPVRDGDAGVGGVMCTIVDNSAKVAAERLLTASVGRFRTAMAAVHGVLWTTAPDGGMVGEQPGWAALTGQGEDDYRGFGWIAALHPDDVERTVAGCNAARDRREMFVLEHRVRRHCGTWRTFAVRAVPILGEDGGIVEWVGVHTDISHQRAAEAALRDHADQLTRQVRHRERAEDQLRHLNEHLEARVIAEIGERRQAEAALAQSQKMETIGKLTGGVAHDFNNLLQVVSGNLQLLGKDVAGNARAERRVANALAGVSRGARLAAQLLAFGRRQALEPKVVNVARIVRGMDDMLRRAIGEGVEVETVVGGGLWNTFIDPAQVENAILNLAINARDAMEGQGRLTVELGNAQLDGDYARAHDEVAPGQYVMLAVSDTGSGMAPDVVGRVFEPFFSTKSEGKGSGLGLSMVYGFVKQSGGHVAIYSEVGEGTTIRLYLPRAMASEDVEVVVDTGPVTGGSETVLVVEDDAGVRETVVALLTDLGYRVLKAVDAASGLAVVESGVPIDLLFTDVVMPGALKSPEMARRARARLPDLAVLFTSGYTENSIVHGGRLDAGVELLSKPYTREALARRVRHVLANQRQRALATRLQRSGTLVAAAPPVQPGAGGATVLLVEDDALIRSSVAEMLQESGYVVVDAGSAEEAMAALNTVAIDILLTDMNLPGASGTELATRARALRPAVRVIYATGDSAAVAHDPAARLLAKPYGAAALLKAVAGEGALTRQAEEEAG